MLENVGPFQITLVDGGLSLHTTYTHTHMQNQWIYSGSLWCECKLQNYLVCQICFKSWCLSDWREYRTIKHWIAFFMKKNQCRSNVEYFSDWMQRWALITFKLENIVRFLFRYDFISLTTISKTTPSCLRTIFSNSSDRKEIMGSDGHINRHNKCCQRWGQTFIPFWLWMQADTSSSAWCWLSHQQA